MNRLSMSDDVLRLIIPWINEKINRFPLVPVPPLTQSPWRRNQTCGRKFKSNVEKKHLFLTKTSVPYI